MANISTGKCPKLTLNFARVYTEEFGADDRLPNNIIAIFRGPGLGLGLSLMPGPDIRLLDNGVATGLATSTTTATTPPAAASAPANDDVRVAYCDIVIGPLPASNSGSLCRATGVKGHRTLLGAPPVCYWHASLAMQTPAVEGNGWCDVAVVRVRGEWQLWGLDEIITHTGLQIFIYIYKMVFMIAIN